MIQKFNESILFQGCNKSANHTFLFSSPMSEYERMSRVNFSFYEAPLAEDIVVER